MATPTEVVLLWREYGGLVRRRMNAGETVVRVMNDLRQASVPVSSDATTSTVEVVDFRLVEVGRFFAESRRFVAMAIECVEPKMTVWTGARELY